MVFLMAAPAVVGATFPGRDRAQMTFRPQAGGRLKVHAPRLAGQVQHQAVGLQVGQPSTMWTWNRSSKAVST